MFTKKYLIVLLLLAICGCAPTPTHPYNVLEEGQVLPPIPNTISNAQSTGVIKSFIIQPTFTITNIMDCFWTYANTNICSVWTGMMKSTNSTGPWTPWGNQYLVPPFSTNNFEQLDVEIGTAYMYYVVGAINYQIPDFQQPSVINSPINITN